MEELTTRAPNAVVCARALKLAQKGLAPGGGAGRLGTAGVLADGEVGGSAILGPFPCGRYWSRNVQSVTDTVRGGTGRFYYKGRMGGERSHSKFQ